jgi:hypothetical protein
MHPGEHRRAHMQDPSTSTPRVRPEDVDWSLKRLRPPTRTDIKLAHRLGLDPNRLLERFDTDYERAFVEDAALIQQLAGDDLETGTALWDYVNDYAVARRREWFIEPRLAVGALLNPSMTVEDGDALDRALTSSMTVNMIVVYTPPPRRSPGRCRVSAPRSRRPRIRRQRRHVARSSSSADSGSDGDPEHVRRFCQDAGLSVSQVRWCRDCGVVAYAVDDHQRQGLDEVGFRELCPGCRFAEVVA